MKVYITVQPGTPTTHEVPNGIDHDVIVRWFDALGRAAEVTGGITLVDGQPYGDTLDHWVGGPLERWARDLPADARREVVRSLASGEGCEEIEVEAAS